MQSTSVGVYNASSHVVSYLLVDGSRAVWNALMPRVVVLNQRAFGLLEGLPHTQHELTAEELQALEAARLIHTCEKDPYEDDFFQSAEAALAAADREAHAFYEERQPYYSLTIVNSGCNLGCSYCVSYYGDDARVPAAREATRGDARLDAIMNIVDQFMTRKEEVGEATAKVNFSGGEILLRWPIVERVLMHMRSRYPTIRVQAHMNTNATLLTPEIARRLAELEVGIAVSIDGYGSLHDRTRHYHTGGGSFDRVIQGITNYRNAGRALNTFQGTIRDFEDFDNDQLFSMAELGFTQTRLAPNVLDTEPRRGVAAAEWEARLAVASMGRAVEVGKTEFASLLALVEKGRDGFVYHCNGLNGLHVRALTLNIDSMQLSQMCSFVSPGALPAATTNYDIYHPSLWSATRQYIVKRMEMLRTACRGCDVLGICQGACVHTGLDVHNKLNPSGCNYQRALFRHVIDYSHSGEVRSIPPGEVRDHQRAAAAADLGHQASKAVPATFYRHGTMR